MRRRAVGWVLLLTLFTVPALGEAELVLLDGTVLRGLDVRRDGPDYVLTREDGQRITLPADLVKSVRLAGSGEAKPDPSTGLTVRREPETLAGEIPDGPTGLRRGEAETLAGGPIRAPTRSEQLEALGPAARFQQGMVDPSWTPSSDWDMDPENNNFAPSTWAEDIVDPSWKPESAWDAGKDVMADSRSTWQKGGIDSTWTPTDGFDTSVGRR